MPRKGPAGKRPVVVDPVYESPLVTQLVNKVLLDGKKSTAESIVYGALALIARRFPKEDPIRIFDSAIDNSKPVLQVKSRRVGGATYQVPVEIAPATRTALAFRWIIDYSRKRGEKTMSDRLAGELLDCYNKTGNTIKKREDTHKMAEANKAFAHLRY